MREEEEYEIQLCAQAMCLEEMYHTKIPRGDILYLTSHRRHSVELDEGLREKVRQTIRAVQRVREGGWVPPANYGPRCRRCSIREACMPQVQASAAAYCEKLAREAKEVESL